jgi:alcohol dehydrogenase
MLALKYSESLSLDIKSIPPELSSGTALLKVIKSGICKTDTEIIKGYMGFEGILGHEFVAIVEDCEDKSWVGKRVVGEINAGCGECVDCKKGLQRHCSNRTVLGIFSHDGCMAEYTKLPIENLLEVPVSVTDDDAVFTEPLSAACEILEQTEINKDDECIVLGDGKLGILIAWVLSTQSDNVTLMGHHQKKMDLAAWNGVKTTLSEKAGNVKADIVVDATGSKIGLTQAINMCKPRGRLILKSTFADQSELDLSPVVINEITIIGSRCGRFEDGLKLIEEYKPPLKRLVEASYPLVEGLEAFEHAQRKGALKILLSMG